MKKLKILLSGFLVGAFAFVAVQLIGCRSNEEEKNSSEQKVVNVSDTKSEEHSCCSTEKDSDEKTDAFSDESIYQLESEWLNQSGEKITLAEFKGKPVVFTMFFASCSYACPILVNDMKKIESKLSAKELQDYRFVLVSIDHERDTPELLNNYSEIHNLDLNRWSLLTGDKDDILELAAVLGFKYKKDEDGQYSHSNLINILDEKGEVVFQHVGLNKDITIAASKLNELNKF